MKGRLRSISQLWVGNVSSLTTADSPLRSFFPAASRADRGSQRTLCVYNSIYQIALNFNCVYVCITHPFVNMMKALVLFPIKMYMHKNIAHTSCKTHLMDSMIRPKFYTAWRRGPHYGDHNRPKSSSRKPWENYSQNITWQETKIMSSSSDFFSPSDLA